MIPYFPGNQTGREWTCSESGGESGSWVLGPDLEPSEPDLRNHSPERNPRSGTRSGRSDPERIRIFCLFVSIESESVKRENRKMKREREREKETVRNGWEWKKRDWGKKCIYREAMVWESHVIVGLGCPRGTWHKRSCWPVTVVVVVATPGPIGGLWRWIYQTSLVLFYCPSLQDLNFF